MRTYTRAYEEELLGFREAKNQSGETDYPDTVKIIIAAYIGAGRETEYMANILGLSESVLIEWYRDLFLNQADLAFRIDEFTYIRELNIIRADARTKGCIIKGIVEETLTLEQAVELVGGIQKQTVKGWIKLYERDYDFMITCPPFTDHIIKRAYAYNKEDAMQLQALIFQHDREENELSSTLGQAYLATR